MTFPKNFPKINFWDLRFSVDKGPEIYWGPLGATACWGFGAVDYWGPLGAVVSRLSCLYGAGKKYIKKLCRAQGPKFE
jgi:hypothetical protein